MNVRESLRNLLAAVGSSALVAGCTVGPDFVAARSASSRSVVPGRQRARSVADARLPAPTDPTWWQVFRDPVLTNLEQRSPTPISTSSTATLRLAESRFQRGVAAAGAIPLAQRRCEVHARAVQPERHRQPDRPVARPSAAGFSIRARSTTTTPASMRRGSSISGARSAGRSKPPTPRSIRPPTSAATRWCRALPNSPGTTCSCAACRPRSGSPTTI